MGPFRTAKEQGGEAGHSVGADGAECSEGVEASLPVGVRRFGIPAPSGGVLSHACILKDGFWPLQIQAGVVGANGDAKYSLHALRHAAAALFIEQGFGPKKVQSLMGPSSIKQTSDTYGYLFPSEEDDQNAMAQIEARLLS